MRKKHYHNGVNNRFLDKTEIRKPSKTSRKPVWNQTVCVSVLQSVSFFMLAEMLFNRAENFSYRYGADNLFFDANEQFRFQKRFPLVLLSLQYVWKRVGWLQLLTIFMDSMRTSFIC